MSSIYGVCVDIIIVLDILYVYVVYMESTLCFLHYASCNASLR